MKKQIALAMGLAVVSGSAFATKARLEALGEDAYGSQFISDNRNIFLNAATVNFHKDMVTYEWGNSDTLATFTSYEGTNVGVATDQDTAQSPKAEGGFLKASGNMVYGLHFGSESNTANGLRTLAMGANAVHETNNIDVFVGGDAGIQWGANLTYSSSENEANDAEQSSLRSRLGVVSGNISAFANINLENSAEQGAAEFDGQSGYQLGATYEMNDMYYMVQHRSFSAEDANSDEISVTYNWIGAAKAYKMNDRSNVWLSAWYKMETVENDFTAIMATGETKSNYLPVTVAAEVEVKDWLTLRGSVGHYVIGTQEADNGDKTTLSDTVVNAGATVSFGDFAVDGLIGNVATSGTGANTVGSTDTSAGNGTLRTDALLSRVSFLYRF